MGRVVIHHTFGFQLKNASKIIENNRYVAPPFWEIDGLIRGDLVILLDAVGKRIHVRIVRRFGDDRFYGHLAGGRDGFDFRADNIYRIEWEKWRSDRIRYFDPKKKRE